MGRGRSSVWVGGTGAVPSWREPTPRPFVEHCRGCLCAPAVTDLRAQAAVHPVPGGCRADFFLVRAQEVGGHGVVSVLVSVCRRGDLQHPGTPDLNIFFYTHFSGVARRCPAPGPPRFCCRVI